MSAYFINLLRQTRRFWNLVFGKNSPTHSRLPVPPLTTPSCNPIDNPCFMVIYNLVSQKNPSFEGWFPSFEDFQKQAQKKLISCPTCGTTKVEKVPHACAVHVKKEQPAPAAPAKKPEPEVPAPPSPAEFKEMLIRVHHYVK